jgi:hypothetical protein
MKIIIFITAILLQLQLSYQVMAKPDNRRAGISVTATKNKNINPPRIATPSATSVEHGYGQNARISNKMPDRNKSLIADLDIVEIKQKCNKVANSDSPFEYINIVSGVGMRHDGEQSKAQNYGEPDADADIVINSILYINQQQWYVWINSKKYGPTKTQRSDFTISSVHPEYVTLKISAANIDIHVLQKNKKNLVLHHEQIEIAKEQDKDIIVIKLGIGQFFQRKTAKVLDFYH